MEIDIWYGDRQSFGHIGNPQRWVNVMGRLTGVEDMASLSYSLNGGQPRPLSIGADIYRLLCDGDFNIDIGLEELAEGDNCIHIVATAKSGDSVTRDVTVHCTKGRTWPGEYTIDWSKVSNILDVAQPVDGLWRIVDGGIRPAGGLGYDRLVAVGDMKWTDYEVTVGMTIHGFDFTGKWPPVVGLLLRWDGHNEDGKQPRVQWWPLGALCWYSFRKQEDGALRPRLDIQSYRLEVVGSEEYGREWEMDVPYWIRARVETAGKPAGTDSMKVWRQDEDEPERWDVTGDGAEGALAAGSFLLLAHHTDVTFGNVACRAL